MSSIDQRYRYDNVLAKVSADTTLGLASSLSTHDAQQLALDLTNLGLERWRVWEWENHAEIMKFLLAKPKTRRSLKKWADQELFRRLTLSAYRASLLSERFLQLQSAHDSTGTHSSQIRQAAESALQLSRLFLLDDWPFPWPSPFDIIDHDEYEETKDLYEHDQFPDRTRPLYGAVLV